MSGAFKRTQLRDLRDALLHLKQSEQVALAQAHARDAAMLEHRVKRDLVQVAQYPEITSALVDKKRKALPPRVDVADLRSDTQFARALERGGKHRVEGRRDCDFRYLDREVSPLRGLVSERRSLDLLLLSGDGSPVLGEVKLKTDSLPSVALIQLLMYAVELTSPSQRKRLVELRVPAESADARMDLFVLSYGTPNKTHHEASLGAAYAIARELMAPGRALTEHVRRIGCFHASADGEALKFRPLFVAE